MEKTTVFISRSEKETEAFAEKLAKELPVGSVLTLDGDLGAEKRFFPAVLPVVSELRNRFQVPLTPLFRNIRWITAACCSIWIFTGSPIPLRLWHSAWTSISTTRSATPLSNGRNGSPISCPPAEYPFASVISRIRNVKSVA